MSANMDRRQWIESAAAAWLVFGTPLEIPQGVQAVAKEEDAAAPQTPRLSGYFLTRDRRMTADSVRLIQEAALAMDQAKFDRATPILQRLRTSSDPLSESVAIAYFGDLALFSGRFADALKEYVASSTAAVRNQQPAVRIFASCREIWLRHLITIIPVDVSAIRREGIDDATAIARLEVLGREAVQTRNEFSEAFVHHTLGVVHQRMGRHEDALRHLQQALAIRDRIGHFNSKTTRAVMADSFAMTGKTDEAMALLRQVEAPNPTLGHTVFEDLAEHHMPLVTAAIMVNVLDEMEKNSTHHDPALMREVVGKFREKIPVTKPMLRDLYKTMGSMMD